MTPKYDINDIVEMKNNMLVEQIDLKLFAWVRIYELNVKIVKEVL